MIEAEIEAGTATAAGTAGETAATVAGRRRQRDQGGLAALTADLQDAVAVFLAQAGDIRAAGFEDPEAEQAEHRDQREVVAVGR